MDIRVDSSFILTWTDLHGAAQTVPCALGHGGIAVKKSEGDGITPVGNFALLSVMVRDDRLAFPETALDVSSINKNDGWCDDATSPYYNCPITLPHSASHERLYRDDALYDIIVDVDYNRAEPIAGKGSAIFIHIAQPGYPPTKGCVALALNDLLKLLKSCDDETQLVISP
jgi:L,D-peptidoglycan transpeptidase YkuD (ErfK/YbiS/YcfS/YnhG family)